MSDHKKMNLSDLQPKPVDSVDWVTLDTFFNVDAPNALGSSLVLTRVITDLRVTELPEVDSGIVMSYLSKMAKDTEQMSNSLAQMRAEYEINKKRYQNKYDENSHMFSLALSHQMHEWLEQYESTIGQSIQDVTDYINSVSPTKINQ